MVRLARNSHCEEENAVKLTQWLFGGRSPRQQSGLAWATQFYPPEHQHTAARVAAIIVEQRHTLFALADLGIAKRSLLAAARV